MFMLSLFVSEKAIGFVNLQINKQLYKDVRFIQLWIIV